MAGPDDSATVTGRLAVRPQSAAEGTRASHDPRVREAAEDFEAVFLAQMLAPMFAGLETDGLFGGGPGEAVYRSLMIEEYGKAMARNGGVGIADAVERELLKLQEVEK